MQKLKLNWKIAFFSLCFSLIILNIILIGNCFKGSGWDFDIYCSAVKTLQSGKNPYLVRNLKEYSGGPMSFSFVYPPISLPFFKMICFINQRVSYHIIWILMLVATFLATRRIDKNFESWLLTTLLTTGFIATYWNLLTGNVGLIELFLFSVTYYWIIKKNYCLSALFLVLASTLKIVPLLFGGLFIFARLSKLDKFKIFSIIAASFASINLLSYILFPSLTSSYYLSIMGQMGQHNPIFEGGGLNNPASFFLIKKISDLLFNHSFMVLLGLYILFVGFIAALLFNYVWRKKRDFVDIFSVGTLAVLIVLPRLKPYSFTFALLPMYFLLKDFDFKNKFWSILLISACPLIFYTAGNFLDLSLNLSWNYSQPICLFIFFMFFLTRDYKLDITQ